MALAMSFDLAKIAQTPGFKEEERESLVFMARTAESAERYEDMCKIIQELVKIVVRSNAALTVEERNLLSVAYKNVIGAKRASLRTLVAEDEDDLMKKYIAQVTEELDDICQEVLSLLKDSLVNSPNSSVEANVFYLKMTGDYYRYLAEYVSNESNKNDAALYYDKAKETAEQPLPKGLPSTHPIRLGLALNYSVCLYEILKQKDKARELAKFAFDEAISKLDELDEADYKDSTLIMQLLRDNLTLWTASADEGDEH